MSITRQMADFVLSLEYADLSSAVLHEARRFTLDSIGCAFAALNNPDMLAAHRYVSKLGGRADSTIIGSGLKTNAADTAFMNSLLVRALDYNDIFWEQDPSHPSDILPAIWATAEKANRSTRDLLLASVIAYELECRWCLAAKPGIREIGWHHASLTQFVSPFVAGLMLGLDRDQMVAAAGISGSSHFTLGGVVAGHLTNMKNSADPMAVEAGVRAALLAAEGYSGPLQVIEGKEGLFEVINSVQWDTDVLGMFSDKEFMILKCGYKAFPTEALTHQPISAALLIREKHNLSPDDIQSVLVETTTRGADILSDASKFDPQTKETADHSLPYCIAAALADGHVLPSSFEQEKIFQANIRALLKKITVKADREIDNLFPKVKRARVTITTQKNETFTEIVDYAKGSPENPLTDQELIAKFEANCQNVVPANQQQRIIDECMELGLKEKPVKGFMEILVL